MCWLKHNGILVQVIYLLLLHGVLLCSIACMGTVDEPWDHAWTLPSAEG